MMQVIMGRQVESLVENIKQINISHQEVDRILKALEEMYSETKANAPAMEWMPVTAVGNLLCHELGYEDMDEFEDAMDSTFDEFIARFPIVETKPDERVTGGHVFRGLQMRPDPPKEEWEPTKQTFWITKGEDLWRVAHKSKHARLTVPSLEFEIQADGQRHIDSIYNHFGNAVTNLAAYASGLPMEGEDCPKVKILETVEELTLLLDVPKPWEIVMYDPSGISEITPDTDVTIERYNPDDDS